MAALVLGVMLIFFVRLSSISRGIHAPVELTCISLSSATSCFLFSSVPVGLATVILHELVEGVPLAIASLSALCRRLRSAASESGASGHSQLRAGTGQGGQQRIRVPLDTCELLLASCTPTITRTSSLQSSTSSSDTRETHEDRQMTKTIRILDHHSF